MYHQTRTTLLIITVFNTRFPTSKNNPIKINKKPKKEKTKHKQNQRKQSKLVMFMS